jgi:hypothetical protein
MLKRRRTKLLRKSKLWPRSEREKRPKRLRQMLHD